MIPSKFYCGLADKIHIVEKPILLTCQHYACFACFDKFYSGRCFLCGQKNLNTNTQTQYQSFDYEIKNYVPELFVSIGDSYKSTINNLKGNKIYYSLFKIINQI